MGKRSVRKFSARRVFAENVRCRRRSLGISQERLADIAGVHRTYVGSVERGECNISIDNMERLAKALDISLPNLLGVSVGEA